MSNHLAIATVSAVLRSLLHAAVTRAASGLNFNVTTGRPEAAQTDASTARVSLFLFQVTPNAAWRNADLPTRRPDGTAVQRPQAAIDLHYLISFAGDESKQVPERLLGAALAILHAQPIISREMIRGLVADPTYNHLSASNLVDQVELVRLGPLAMTIDELSKLWSVFFQIPYRLSVAWQASVVLLDVEVPTERALPVLSRHVEADPFQPPKSDDGTAGDGPDRPIVVGLSVGTPLGGGTSRTLTVNVASPVKSSQKAILLLNGHGTMTGAFVQASLPRTADGDSLVFPLPAEALGTYLVRVQVDSVESLLVRDPNDPDNNVPFSGPLVTIS
ncbi:MAG TPA: DUF4255 domain-containing protein [Thermoanaerobaculia bacterium]|nr:DUF4255 domain-containing protein [Thermoanaerobaculia bacterium]